MLQSAVDDMLSALFPGVNLHHADHGVPLDSLRFLLTLYFETTPGGFWIMSGTLPSFDYNWNKGGLVPLSDLENGLYGPASGDDNVLDTPNLSPDEPGAVWHEARGGRDYTDRLTNRPTRPTRQYQVIGAGQDIYTVYGGPLALQNPQDPGCPDVAASAHYWAVHALACPRSNA